MTAKDYPVYFDYLETTTINGKTYTHRGRDRCNKEGVVVEVAGVRIGLVGHTGLVSPPGEAGAHLHTQAGTDIACQNTIHPGPLEFKPGKVVKTGVGSEWGNFVTVQVGSLYITYCHLQRIDVSVGQELNNNVSPEEKADYLKFKEEFARLRYLLSGRPANKISQQERRLRLDMNFEQVNKALADGGLNIIEPAKLLDEIESLKKDAKVLPPGKYIVEE